MFTSACWLNNLQKHTSQTAIFLTRLTNDIKLLSTCQNVNCHIHSYIELTAAVYEYDNNLLLHHCAVLKG